MRKGKVAATRGRRRRTAAIARHRFGVPVLVLTTRGLWRIVFANATFGDQRPAPFLEAMGLIDFNTSRCIDIDISEN
jgi:hypothetical protein